MRIAVIIVLQLIGVVSQNVQQVQLKVFLAQQQVLVLRMNVDELAANLLQQRQVDRRVVDKCAAFAFSGQLAANDAM